MIFLFHEWPNLLITPRTSSSSSYNNVITCLHRKQKNWVRQTLSSKFFFFSYIFSCSSPSPYSFALCSYLYSSSHWLLFLVFRSTRRNVIVTRRHVSPCRGPRLTLVWRRSDHSEAARRLSQKSVEGRWTFSQWSALRVATSSFLFRSQLHRARCRARAPTRLGPFQFSIRAELRLFMKDCFGSHGSQTVAIRWRRGGAMVRDTTGWWTSHSWLGCSWLRSLMLFLAAVFVCSETALTRHRSPMSAGGAGGERVGGGGLKPTKKNPNVFIFTFWLRSKLVTNRDKFKVVLVPQEGLCNWLVFLVERGTSNRKVGR